MLAFTALFNDGTKTLMNNLVRWIKNDPKTSRQKHSVQVEKYLKIGLMQRYEMFPKIV